MALAADEVLSSRQLMLMGLHNQPSAPKAYPTTPGRSRLSKRTSIRSLVMDVDKKRELGAPTEPEEDVPSFSYSAGLSDLWDLEDEIEHNAKQQAGLLPRLKKESLPQIKVLFGRKSSTGKKYTSRSTRSHAVPTDSTTSQQEQSSSQVNDGEDVAEKEQENGEDEPKDNQVGVDEAEEGEEEDSSLDNSSGSLHSVLSRRSITSSRRRSRAAAAQTKRQTPPSDSLMGEDDAEESDDEENGLDDSGGSLASVSSVLSRRSLAPMGSRRFRSSSSLHRKSTLPAVQPQRKLSPKRQSSRSSALRTPSAARSVLDDEKSVQENSLDISDISLNSLDSSSVHSRRSHQGRRRTVSLRGKRTSTSPKPPPSSTRSLLGNSSREEESDEEESGALLPSTFRRCRSSSSAQPRVDFSASMCKSQTSMGGSRRKARSKLGQVDHGAGCSEAVKQPEPDYDWSANNQKEDQSNGSRSPTLLQRSYSADYRKPAAGKTKVVRRSLEEGRVSIPRNKVKAKRTMSVGDVESIKRSSSTGKLPGLSGNIAAERRKIGRRRKQNRLRHSATDGSDDQSITSNGSTAPSFRRSRSGGSLSVLTTGRTEAGAKGPDEKFDWAERRRRLSREEEGKNHKSKSSSNLSSLRSSSAGSLGLLIQEAAAIKDRKQRAASTDGAFGTKLDQWLKEKKSAPNSGVANAAFALSACSSRAYNGEEYKSTMISQWLEA